MRTHRTAALVAAGLVALVLAAPAWAQGFKDLEKQVVEKTLPNGLKVILLPRQRRRSSPWSPTPTSAAWTRTRTPPAWPTSSSTWPSRAPPPSARRTSPRRRRPCKGGRGLPRPARRAAAASQARPGQSSSSSRRPSRRPRTRPGSSSANEFGEIIEREGGAGPQRLHLLRPDRLPSTRCPPTSSSSGPPSRRTASPTRSCASSTRRRTSSWKRSGWARASPPAASSTTSCPWPTRPTMYRSFVIGHMSDLLAITREPGQGLVQQVLRRQEPHRRHRRRRRPHDGHAHAGEVPGHDPRRRRSPGPGHRGAPAARREAPHHGRPLPALPDHRLPPPDINDPDYAVYEAIADILGGGRSSRLYKTLVKEKKLALDAAGMPT